MQERTRRGADTQLLALPHHIEPVERFHRRLRLAVDMTEGREVVPADQTLRCSVHRLVVERPRQPPGAPALECEIGAAVDDAIAVVPFDRREARVERVGYL